MHLFGDGVRSIHAFFLVIFFRELVFFFRVAAAFFALAERDLAGRPAEAFPPSFPLFFIGFLFVLFPWPEPLFLPPPEEAFTVAQAFLSASTFESPRFS